MFTRTQEEIARQIEGLKQEKETLPEFSMFGNNNWENIDAQIAILRGDKEPDDFWQDESAEEFEDGDNDPYFAAVEAENWLENAKVGDLFSDDDE